MNHQQALKPYLDDKEISKYHIAVKMLSITPARLNQLIDPQYSENIRWETVAPILDKLGFALDVKVKEDCMDIDFHWGEEIGTVITTTKMCNYLFMDKLQVEFEIMLDPIFQEVERRKDGLYVIDHEDEDTEYKVYVYEFETGATPVNHGDYYQWSFELR